MKKKKVWHDHWDFVKQTSLNLFSKVDEPQIRSFYSYYVHTDYEEPITASVEEMEKDVSSYISNLEYSEDKISTLFYIIQDLVQSFPNIGKDRSSYCETCGDSNYSHEIRVGN